MPGTPNYTGLAGYSHDTVPQVGVLLVNLGTPEAPTAAAVRPYLAEFLGDPRVIEYPRLLWLAILHGVILRVRPKRSAHAYARIWTEQGSPLRVGSEALAAAHDEAAGREEAGAADAVHELHDGEVLEVLLGQEPDGDVEDVELVLLAKVQQQIERPLELRELHRPRRCASIERLAIGHGGGANSRQMGCP